MQLTTKISVILSEDANNARRLFSIEDSEEITTTPTKGDSKGVLTIAGGATETVNLAHVAHLGGLFLFVTGDVSVRPNGDDVGFPVKSEGTSGASDFRYGKFFFVSNSTTITSLLLVNNDADNAAQVYMGLCD